MSDEGSEGAVYHEGGEEAIDGTFPVDLLAIILLAAGVVYLTWTSGPRTSTARIVLGFGFVFFAPGYALVSLLLPTSTLESDAIAANSDGTGPLVVTTVERVVLSIGFSVILVPLVGIVLNYSSLGVRPVPMVASIGALTFVLSLLAVARRLQVPSARRYGALSFGGLTRLREWVAAPDNRFEIALNVVLVVGLLVAVAGGGLALVTVDNGERYTEFYLLSEDSETGELVADEYPTQLTPGEEAELYVGITNQERERTTYTVVVLVDQMTGAPGNKTVVERTEVDRFQRTLEHGETWEGRHTVDPSVEGERVRVTYLLYAGSPPAEPSVDNAYRNVHIWIDVSDSDRQG